MATTESLANEGKEIALEWLENVMFVINTFEYCFKNNVYETNAPSHLKFIFEAYSAHFQLKWIQDKSLMPPGKKLANAADLLLIRANYEKIWTTLKNSVRYFRFISVAAVPEKSKDAVIYTYGGSNGTINFNEALFVDYLPSKSETPSTGFGKFARASMVLHECVHIVDNLSGFGTTHIYEHSHAYDSQSTIQAIHNASSYTSFAQHITFGSDTRNGAGMRDISLRFTYKD